MLLESERLNADDLHGLCNCMSVQIDDSIFVFVDVWLSNKNILKSVQASNLNENHHKF